jgi:hypothetical protein
LFLPDRERLHLFALFHRERARVKALMRGCIRLVLWLAQRERGPGGTGLL